MLKKKPRPAPKGHNATSAGRPPGPVLSSETTAINYSLLLSPPPPPSSSAFAPRAPSSSTLAPPTTSRNGAIPPPPSNSAFSGPTSSGDTGTERKLLRKRPSAAVAGGPATRGGEGGSLLTAVPVLDEAVVLRDLLAWDLLAAVDAQRSGRRSPPPPSAAAPSSSSDDHPSDPTSATPPASLVRERFESVAQYRSLWLRLALRETRAVVLNQVAATSAAPRHARRRLARSSPFFSSFIACLDLWSSD